MQDELTDWNDLRLVLAVGRAHRLTGAAKQLGVDHSTVFRRLQQLEIKLGVSLFERLPGGLHRPTEVGEQMLASAERIEGSIIDLTRKIAGRDKRLVGRLRITSSETLAFRLLTRHIAAFRSAHPGVVVELAVDNRVLNLSRREADVALRPMRPIERDLWGRKLADVAWGVYGARSYIQKTGTPVELSTLSQHPLIGWEEGTRGIATVDWLNATIPAASFVFRTNSLVNQLMAVRASIGLAVLPCYLGDPEPSLCRAIAKPLKKLQGELWIVTHVDLKKTARVRAFFDILAEGVRADRQLIEGRSMPARP